jgi:uncharacterized protein (TIGR02646 family)
MRFILQDDVYDGLPPNWNDRVTKAKAYVEGKVKKARAAAVAAGNSSAEIEERVLEARHQAINAKSAVWRAAEKALRMASHGKCWYCESSQGRSDMPVDHFRPKNSVSEAIDHPGYWWLAFDWRNYRYSCTYCNSKRRDIDGGTEGGKQDHFPIIPPPPHARSDTDPRDRAKLLDPTDDADTKLLTFLPNGFPHPMKGDPVSIDRVKESVGMYHLDHGPLVKRRKRIADDISQHVENANAASASGDEVNYRFHKKEIIKRVRANADYSSAARVYLQAYRTHHWVEEILSHDL